MDLAIRLDRNRDFSEVRGERTPDDPHYKVHFMQGGKMGGHVVLLPFDAHGELVPDDGKTAPYPGQGTDAKGNTITTTYHPLWTPRMRAYRDAKLKKMAEEAAAKADPNYIDEGSTDIVEDAADPAANVDFAAYLKGTANYQPHVLREAAKRKFALHYAKIPDDLVPDLVFDHQIVPEDAVCTKFQPLLKPKAAFAAPEA
jgi:hypothetical protein